VEAALGVGDRSLASEVTQRLQDLALAGDHPWAAASALRCRALLTLAERGDDPNAREDLVAAADAYLATGCAFDAGRSLLALGRHARRGRKWAVARGALERSATIFDDLGCDGWAARARSLLDGVGGRRPSAAGLLTPSERRAAELAGEGKSNKDIAAALFVSVHTVEVHLGRAYAKLGIQSRSQLSRALVRAGLEGDPAIN
jgi:DNA-binding CsgD family transcriptional regulator